MGFEGTACEESSSDGQPDEFALKYDGQLGQIESDLQAPTKELK